MRVRTSTPATISPPTKSWTSSSERIRARPKRARSDSGRQRTSSIPQTSADRWTRGIAALDAYLSADSAGVYREQAIVLRRTAAVAQGIASAPKAAVLDTLATPAVKDTVVVVSKSRDEQIAMLKDQLAKSKEDLAKANAELDRIKKRLANPSN